MSGDALVLGGYCQTGLEQEAKHNVGRPEWHRRCAGVWKQSSGLVRCSCGCHSGSEQPRDLDAEIKAARLARELRGGEKQHYPGTAAKPAARADGKCKNEHEMTPENTGPGNVCRQCKRDASRRHKEKRAQAQTKTTGEKP